MKVIFNICHVCFVWQFTDLCSFCFTIKYLTGLNLKNANILGFCLNNLIEFGTLSGIISKVYLTQNIRQ